jgi:DNA repair exonuclease SbcCD nuclease subunit
VRLRLLQTGDLHVGRGRTAFGERVVLERTNQLFDALYREAEAQKCHGVLITGDIFDTKTVTNPERNLVTRKLMRYAGKNGIPTFVIPGNHDLTTATSGNLDYLAEVAKSGETPNLHVAFSHTVEVWETEWQGLSIIGAPVGFSESQTWLDDYVTRLPKDVQYVFMGHGSIQGCVRNDAGWKPTMQEDSKRLSLANAASLAPQIVWWAYGDIHKRQKLPTLPEGANGWYAGSPIQMDFGEQPDRGCLVVALDKDDDGWKFTGKRYVRLDTPENGFAPLITVTDPDQIDKLPKEALIRLAKGVVLSSEKHKQVVRELKVVDDRSLPAMQGADGIEVFDPLLADLSAVEKEVLGGLKAKGDKVEAEAKKVVGLAVEKYRERTYVS